MSQKAEFETKDTQIEALEAKIKELEEKLAEREAAAAEEAEAAEAETAAEVTGRGEKILNGIKSSAEQLYADLTPFIEKYKSEQGQVVRIAQDKICERPFVAVAAAFGIGVVISKLLERKINIYRN